MAYRSIAQRRTCNAWAQRQHHMARIGMAALWLLGATGLLVVVLASLGGGAWLAVQMGIGG